LLLALLAMACGHGTEALRPAIPPNDRAAWQGSLHEFAGSLFAALRDNRLEPVLVPFDALDAFLTPRGRIRVEHERSAHRPNMLQAAVAQAWAKASYVGFCTQGVHAEPPHGSYGLRSDAWIVDRILVVGLRNRSRTAAWVEGTFVHTSRGWRALSLGRIEVPRSHHSDLEVALCDVEYGIR
jgi:hypothetical protein